MDDECVFGERETDHGQYRVRIVADEDCENPRGTCDLGVIVIVTLRDRRHLVPQEDGDTVNAPTMADAIQDHDFRVVSRWLRLFHGATVVLPLHGGGGEERFIVGDPDETPEVDNYCGVVFDQPSGRERCGTPPELMEKGLKDEVGEYLKWAAGETYGWIVERSTDDGNTWDEVDSVWGYIGLEWAEEAATDGLNEAVAAGVQDHADASGEATPEYAAAVMGARSWTD